MEKLWAACMYTEKPWATGGDDLKKRERKGEGQDVGDSCTPTDTPARRESRDDQKDSLPRGQGLSAQAG